MCGIWFYLTKPGLLPSNLPALFTKYLANQNRGPDNSDLKILKDYGLMIGFHRLKIMDQSTKGDQPFILENEDVCIYVICNGEIYNYRTLAEKYHLDLKSSSDCEVIGHLYTKIGLPALLQELIGEFAFCIFELNKKTHEVVLNISRDPCGVRPLYYEIGTNFIMGSSTLNGLLYETADTVQQFPPRNYLVLNSSIFPTKFDQELKFIPYLRFEEIPILYNLENTDLVTIHQKIRETLIQCVQDRIMSDRKIGALVSGGVDSSLTASILAEACRIKGITLHTFSLSMHPNSPDQIAAIKVSKHIGSSHRHILIPPHEWIQARKKVIQTINSYDVTTVRASTGQYLLAKWISENTDIKVLIIGDGADELANGYKYNLKAPDAKALHDEAIFRLNDIHYFDVLRADRCISAFGLEARVPFLDPRMIKLYLSIDPRLRMPNYPGLRPGITQEKKLLREAFHTTDYLSMEILYRPKEAFSDGVSLVGESWYEIIQKDVQKMNLVMDSIYLKQEFQDHIVPTSEEEHLYRKIFRSIYGSYVDQIVPYKWLPKWCGDITEPSARVLEVYTVT